MNNVILLFKAEFYSVKLKSINYRILKFPFFISSYFFLLFIVHSSHAQKIEDENRTVEELNEACKENWFSDTNLSVHLGTQSSEKALKEGNGEGLATAYNNLGVAFWVRGELDRALRLYYLSINVRDSVGGDLGLGNTYHNIANVFRAQENFGESKNWFNKALKIRHVINDSLGLSYSLNNLGLIAQTEKKYDSAHHYLNQSLSIRQSLKNVRGIATSHMSLGKLYIELNELEKAEQLLVTALEEWESIKHSQGQADSYIELARLSSIKNNQVQLQDYIEKGIAVAKSIQAKPQLLSLYELSADAYLEELDTLSSFKQLQKAYLYRIDIYNQQREGMIQQYNLDQITYDNEILQKENLLQKEQILRQEGTARAIGIIAFFLVLLLILAYFLLRMRIRSNKKLTLSNRELNQTLENLKQTQSKLVQSEKMASLGTLTAGVSHEINNPLNFVQGAYDGLSEYFDKNKSTEFENTEALLDIIKTGIERISKIVKGLNQFSRTNENMNEACDIHSILDNCLTILHDKHKNRVDIIKEFSTDDLLVMGNVGKLHQVFLNILSNAIQAIPNDGKIILKTRIKQKYALVEILDNGVGISQDNIKQITDPFYTTKPPGEGTGLGLSISNSIILDHGGALKFESEEKFGTKVIVELPHS
ncbi:MAG: tetratricopeptide repeat protein [Cyclobacteriaceae bacterium]